ncbi:SDR family oxidoreductase [Frankia sp. R82]|nr:SDR family oxidoreductase [Frankia sp. R82]
MIACDATNQASCKAAIDEAAAGMGGIDALVYATGVGHLARLVDLSHESWPRSFDNNVVGASFIAAAAVPYLTKSNAALDCLAAAVDHWTASEGRLGPWACSTTPSPHSACARTPRPPARPVSDLASV